jgi:hypothetical protein
MKIFEETREYRVYLAEKNLVKRVNQATNSLLHILGIDPHGCGLVLLCGKPNDRTNTDAIRTWVTKALCCPSCMKVKTIGLLANRLQRELADKCEYMNY